MKKWTFVEWMIFASLIGTLASAVALTVILPSFVQHLLDFAVHQGWLRP